MYSWDELEKICLNCTKCELHKNRTNVVIGGGNKKAQIMFIGEGPGKQEDLQGKPFVGRAGQLLDKMLEAIDLDRSKVYIANIVKCRPPNNRDPKPDEQKMCLDYLRNQVLLIKPRIIVCLGRISAQAIIDRNFRITRDRGKWIERKGYHLTATYHPAALLRDPRRKQEAWQDLQSIQQKCKELNVLI